MASKEKSRIVRVFTKTCHRLQSIKRYDQIRRMDEQHRVKKIFQGTLFGNRIGIAKNKDGGRYIEEDIGRAGSRRFV